MQHRSPFRIKEPRPGHRRGPATLKTSSEHQITLSSPGRFQHLQHHICVQHLQLPKSRSPIFFSPLYRDTPESNRPSPSGPRIPSGSLKKPSMAMLYLRSNVSGDPPTPAAAAPSMYILYQGKGCIAKLLE